MYISRQAWKDAWSEKMNESSRFFFLSFLKEKLRGPHSGCLTLCAAVSDARCPLVSKKVHNCFDLAHYK